MDFTNIEAHETSDVGYKTQLEINKCSNIEIYSCNLTVPETAPNTVADGGIKEYTNIDLYSGWSNIIINNCNLKILHDGEAGGCIWIRDILNIGCKNIKFINNSCYKICHDEILAVWGNIDNIEISNNNFKMLEKKASPSVICFGFGDENHVLNNVHFDRNKVDCISSMTLFRVNGNTKNISIENNDITYKKSNTNTSMYLMYADAKIKSINNNNINIYSSDNIKNNMYIFVNVANVKNNNINIYGTLFGDIFCGNENVENNIVYLDKDVEIQNIFNGTINIYNNSIVANNHINHMVQVMETKCEKNIEIRKNTIEYNYNEENEESHVLMINGAWLNGNMINFEDNVIKTQKISSTSRLMMLVINDTNSQTINIKNNVLGGYEKIYRNDNMVHNIILEHNSK